MRSVQLRADAVVSVLRRTEAWAVTFEDIIRGGEHHNKRKVVGQPEQPESDTVAELRL